MSRTPGMKGIHSLSASIDSNSYDIYGIVVFQTEAHTLAIILIFMPKSSDENGQPTGPFLPKF